VLLVTDGGVAFWNNGLLRVTDPEDLFGVTVGWLGYNLLSILIYLAQFGFLAQFIFRYLTLCRSVGRSAGLWTQTFACINVFHLKNEMRYF
jgi:hypothetical protein